MGLDHDARELNLEAGRPNHDAGELDNKVGKLDLIARDYRLSHKN
jgi:hypothetical protein